MTMISADWLYSGAGLIQSNSGIRLDAQGRIVSIEHQAGSDHFAGAVLMPGLVNAHTHLELTGFEGQDEEPDFPRWIRRLIELKAGRSEDDFFHAAQAGLQASFATGVTTVADTGSSAGPLRALAELGGSGIAYLEVFGPHPDAAAANIAAYEGRLRELSSYESPRIRLGVSPHAPYSVSGPLYRAAAQLARNQRRPIAVHIAESQAESDLLERATGPFAEMWRSRDIALPSLPGRSPLAWLETHEVLGPQALCIHVVRADAADIARLGRHQCGVAHCPRSNGHHGHGAAPLGAFRQAGLKVGLGTDSAASINPPDLLAEARAAAQLAGLTAPEAIRMATLSAAEAIGLDREVGSLEAGKWADFTLVRLPAGTVPDRLPDAILESTPDDVIATFVGGREVFRA
ncbi:MAG TPA: amidohydrolase family protein [Gemmatimonadales bacterium]|nr:amidohydrolase family protein [Gemmatimonadales bacterium]